MTRRPTGCGARLRRDDAGSAPLEGALVTVGMVMLILLVVYAGRTSATSTHLESAAAAARAASLQATPAAAAAAARDTASANLDRREVTCASFDVQLTAADLAPGGSVTVTVHCAVDFSRLAPIAPWGQRDFDARATESVDTFRGSGDGFSNSEGSSSSNRAVGAGE
jgi:Flp pilus assembly protein TadG